MEDQDLISLTADIVSAMVSNNPVATKDLPELIASVHAALGNAGKPVEVEQPKQEPAVSIRSSIKHDYIVCLEDGVKLKMLKRYLRTNFDMSPEDYRAKWGLPRDYPMVAPAYAETRRELAHKIGLGRKSANAAPAKKLTGAAAKAKAAEHLGGEKPKRGRPPKAKTEPAVEAATSEA